ncbi:MAG: Conserved putative secreted protein [Amycolatopsis sp.]|uniref:hypothetical protein n=1 Tax=Amycolatopsis sp. TaxID=37632 RepID=UPI00262C50FB|nr:hypothetical protein [Amycolatopsis sp.]MCU1687233.1 Conserved putative secreted protein [Amycolatopsis sp.]
MQGRTRRATAIGAAAFALAGSAALALPGTASAADTVTATCGSSVTAKPGDHIIVSTILGPVDFGAIGQVSATLSNVIGGVLGTLCNVTVNVVNTVVAPVPVIGAPAASAVNGVVAGTTKGLSDAAANGANSLSSQPAKQQPPAGGSPLSPTGGSPAGNTPVGGQAPGSMPIPDSNSPVLANGFGGLGSLPLNFSTGYAPMRDYSTIPMAMAGVYAPSPGLRYGGQIPGYAPEFGLPGTGGTNQDSSGIQNAGQAQALPAGDGTAPGVGLPVLIAVLSLSGVSAGLVRTWVLRRTAASY